VKKEKVIVMLSGGLDSRLAVKLMQEKGFEVLALFFKLPFGTGCCDENCSFNFSQLQGIKLKIFDCTKGKLLQEYLEVIKKAQHGTGAGVNSCIDCRIFMLGKAKSFADKEEINLIVTGEVLDERPMSQTKKAMEIVEKKSDLVGRLVRPLCDIGIRGRSRKKQIELAKKFNITYPNPAGGCLLCEKFLKNRFNFLFERGIGDNEIKLVGIGRHFSIKGCWVILGKDEKENKILELIGKNLGDLVISTLPGPTALILDFKEDIKKDVSNLIKAYSNKNLEERKKFDKWRL